MDEPLNSVLRERTDQPLSTLEHLVEHRRGHRDYDQARHEVVKSVRTHPEPVVGEVLHDAPQGREHTEAADGPCRAHVRPKRVGAARTVSATAIPRRGYCLELSASRELVRNDDEVEHAPEARQHRSTDKMPTERPLQLGHRLDWLAVDRQNQIARSYTRACGRSVADDLADLDAAGTTELAGESRRQRALLAGHTEVGATETAFRHQRADDLPRRRIDRHRETEADPGNGSIDADDTAAAVGQCATRVAGVECRVGLDDVVDDTHVRTRPRRE